ncbi:FAD-dependent oxidoreductase [Streptomyces sp. NPDC059467]|uniref:FAD-dependent oxidoreductase n=1 Tax=Streptomyces sp. NPDC059467 TaxID=3346844 RepID=UPI00368EFCCB
MTPTPLPHALIIGSGVAGPVVAMALQRAGIASTVFERDAEPANLRGSWLNLQANGMDALQAIDAEAGVDALGFPVEAISFVNGGGRSLGRMPMAARRPDGRTSRMLPRADLYTALQNAAADRGTQVVHGKRFVDAQTLADGSVRALFADGTSAVGDLLIGCDGIHSRVRTVIDPQARTPRYVPVLNSGGYIPNFRVDVPAGEFRMQFGTRCFFGWAPTPDGGTVWFSNPPMATEPKRAELSAISDAQWRHRLHDLMDGDAGPAHDIIDAAPDEITAWPTYDLPKVDKWHNHRNMIIIGDAAHATAPSAGQGASMALEDAVVLAQCLRDCPDTTSAFVTFESLRRARVQKIVKHGNRSSNSKAAGPVGRVVRDLMLPVIFRQVAKGDGKSMMWLQGHHIDFGGTVIPAARR